MFLQILSAKKNVTGINNKIMQILKRGVEAYGFDDKSTDPEVDRKMFHVTFVKCKK